MSTPGPASPCVLSLHDVLMSKFGAARERLERLVAQDSMHVDAVERLAGLELFDPILVPRGSGERPRGSMNRATNGLRGDRK